MTFKEIREQSGMNLTQFSEYFGIPYRTLQHWEHGTRSCPEYLLELMKYKLNNDKANAPVRHGEWIPYFEEVEIYNSGGFKERKQTGWICGKCKTKSSFVSYQKRFCGYCGADMRKGGAK